MVSEENRVFYYCKKCGRLVRCDKDGEQCDYCLSVVYPVPDEYLGGVSKGFIIKGLKEQFINEYIKSAPEFDQYLFDHRAEDLMRRRMENRAKMAHGKAIMEGKRAQRGCIYCGSTQIRKIGIISRTISTELWGLGSKKIGKQFHCNSCGADF